MVDAGASSFGKAFVLYALPMSLLRRELKKTILLRASALAAFMGIAKVVQMLLHNQNHKTTKYYAHAIAGGLGAMIALAIDRGLGSNTLVIWFGIRAALCAIEESSLGKTLQKVPQKSTIVMCIAASHILSTWVRYPRELDPGYCKFLTYQGGRPAWAMQRFAAPNAPVQYPLIMIRKPGTSAISDATQFFIAGVKRAGSLYLPLYVASVIFAVGQARNRTKDRIGKILFNFLSNVARSSVFLSAYCTIAWHGAEILRFISRDSYRIGATRASLRRHVWVSGLATLIERKERRTELATYCLTYAIDAIWRRMETAYPLLKKTKPILAAIILTISCSVLLHHYNKQPALVTKYILSFDSLEENCSE